MGKAISRKPLLLAITLSGLSTVIIYAAVSAAAAGLLFSIPHRNKVTVLLNSYS
jgi:hypothetical protein